jgi:calcineurin-like phosphoesterase family protein
VIDKINSLCRPEDVLLVLGDFCLNTTLAQFDGFIHRINPSVLMISGNHGSPWESAYLDWSMSKFGHEALNVVWPNYNGMRYYR